MLIFVVFNLVFVNVSDSSSFFLDPQAKSKKIKWKIINSTIEDIFSDERAKQMFQCIEYMQVYR